MIIKVAIVEDNLEDQALMSGILEQWSRIRTEGVCKIRKDYYETGENFLAEVRKFQLKYHLIFMDVGLGVHIPQELRIRSRGTERHSASN